MLSRARKVRKSDRGLVQRVFDTLRREIADGSLQPGDALSRQLIARRLGVSATPVIEALVRLEQTGLIEIEAGQMARVRRVTLESIQNDYALREAIEVQAIRLACERATAAEIQDLRRLAILVDDHLDERRRADPASGAALDGEFHTRVAELSRVPVLLREFRRFALGRHLRQAWLTPIAIGEPLRQHGLLVDLIERRDVLGADAEMRGHIQRGFQDEYLAYQRRMMN